MATKLDNCICALVLTCATQANAFAEYDNRQIREFESNIGLTEPDVDQPKDFFEDLELVIIAGTRLNKKTVNQSVGTVADEALFIKPVTQQLDLAVVPTGVKKPGPLSEETPVADNTPPAADTAAEDEFFDNIELDSQESSDDTDDFFTDLDLESETPSASDPSRISWSADFSQQWHLALQDQQQSLSFERSDTGLALSRASVKLSSKFNLSDSVILRLGAFAYENGYEDEDSAIEIDESYIEVGPFKRFKYKFGRQFAVFGESDFFRVIDVVNPVDQREVGLGDIDDTRIPILASRFSYIGDRWGTDFVSIHEHRPSRIDVAGGDFDPFIALGGGDLEELERSPKMRSLVDSVAARLFFTNSWGDISFVVADVYNYDATLNTFSPAEQAFRFNYPKYKLAGFSANIIAGQWVIATDYGFRDSVNYLRNSQSITGSSTVIGAARHDVQLGFRYGGIKNTTVNFELSSQYLDNNSRAVDSDRITVFSAFDVSHSSRQDRLTHSLFVFAGLQSDSSTMVRLQSKLDVNDSVSIKGGFISYDAKESSDLLFPFTENARFFLGFNYSI